MTTYSDKDIKQFENAGISKGKVDEQIENFKKGFPFVKLSSPATPDHGIIKMNDDVAEAYITRYEKESKQKKLVKFVPASGAASRMFKAMFAFLENKDPNDPSVKVVKKINDFAFGADLRKQIRDKGLSDDVNTLEGQLNVAEHMLTEKGLNYGQLPKGLITFHAYEKGNRTAFEEHLVEAAVYATDGEGVARIHFTVSPEHQEAIKQHINEVVPSYEKQYNITYDISYSIQHPSTDTIAVDMDNKPFRKKDGSILFRPGGHGALIENLNNVDADVIFIKNIDNVVPDRLKSTTYFYKKLLGGFLFHLQENVNGYLGILEKGNVSAKVLNEIKDFAANELGLELSGTKNLEQDLKEKLNRPIRVCGMVKNEGEPGGGPFWVKDDAGNESLQIIEKTQIDVDNKEQLKILEQSTHFNPVDLVCGVKNHKGEKFDLRQFVDPETGFISYKSKGGKDLKAQELPGLWNGAMAYWNTIFVEVPVLTFNPVKTVGDLLREQHINP